MSDRAIWSVRQNFKLKVFCVKYTIIFKLFQIQIRTDDIYFEKLTIPNQFKWKTEIVSSIWE